MKASLFICLLLTFGAFAKGENTPELIETLKYIAENEIETSVPLTQFYWNLASAYDLGDGVLEDKKEAYKWYRKLAESGDVRVQYVLGGGYLFGYGLIEDKVQAYAWFNISAANGYETSKEYKTLAAKGVTMEQVAEAQKISREMIKANPKLIGD